MNICTIPIQNNHCALMGIVNVTPDSFSDGGKFLDGSKAVEHALQLAKEGADIIDIGGESTRPGALPVSTDDELARVIPVIEGIRRKSGIPISIDTTKSAVAKAALHAGANMINDISAGRFDPEMFSLAAHTQVPICLMHMKGTPSTMQKDPHYDDVMVEIISFLKESIELAEKVGVKREMIMVDPGIGFGKTVEDNLIILKRLGELKKLGVPIVIGTSRKSFIGKVLDVDIENRLEGTLATLAASIQARAKVLRVHDVAAAKRFVTMYLACL
ncbi:MAG: dihydropteroate synthase [Pseudomonadota bacterium]